MFLGLVLIATFVFVSVFVFVFVFVFVAAGRARIHDFLVLLPSEKKFLGREEPDSDARGPHFIRIREIALPSGGIADQIRAVQVHVPLQLARGDAPHARAGLSVAVPGRGGVHGDGQVQRGEDGGDLQLKFGQVCGVPVRRLEARLVAEDCDVVAGPVQAQQPGGDVRGPERPVAGCPRVGGARERFYERSVLTPPGGRQHLFFTVFPTAEMWSYQVEAGNLCRSRMLHLLRCAARRTVPPHQQRPPAHPPSCGLGRLLACRPEKVRHRAFFNPLA